MIRVWDGLVRVAHWSLMLGICAAWFTRHGPGRWHEWIGYAVLAVVAVRLIWGFTGSRYARFAQFVHPPASTLQYAKDLIAHREARHLGHNPLGAWMIVALLLTTIAVCVTGWLYTTDRFWGVTWMEVLHEWLSHTLFTLAALHISGVVFSSLRHGENLVATMLHGNKRAPGPDDVT